ncbi:hypothetical protein KCU95_g8681, partial [Aureobasidium melanogenum]
MSWFGMAAFDPIGLFPEFIPMTEVVLSTPYVSVVSTTPGEWYTDAKATTLGDSFITWLAHDPVALSAVPKIMSCSPVSGAGAPNVHIRASFLTTSSAVTSTTNAMFINKATTTSVVPASQPPPAGPMSTTPSTIQTTKATQSPSKQPSGQADQPSGQVFDQPNPSPSNPPTEVSQELGSPSQGPNESPTTSEISLNEPGEQPTITSGASNQPVTQKTTADSPTAPIQSSGEPVSIGDQHSAQITSAGGQASNLPESKPVDSQAATQEVSAVDTIQKTAVVSGTSPTETSQAPPPVAIGGITVSHASNGYIVGSQTLAFGGSAIEVSGTTYSLHASGGTAEVNGQDFQVTTLAPSVESAAPIVLGDSTGRPVTSGAYVVADQTLSRGGPAIEISGTTYSLKPSGDKIAVNGKATPVSVLQATLVQPATVVIGGVTAVPESSGAYYVVAGQTLSPGASAIEISSVTYSLPKSGVNIVVNGATSYANAANTPAPVILGSVTAASFIGGGYIVSSQTLSPGGTQVEIAGTTYSLAASGNTVFVDGKPTAIRSAAPVAPVTEATSLANAVNTPMPVTFGSVTAAPFIAGGYVLASQVLNPGGTEVEVSGTTYSLATSGNTVFIDGKPTTFQNVAVAAPLTIGSQTFTDIAASATPLVIASQTLTPGGPAITISGTTYSLPPSGTDSIVANGQTKSLAQVSGIAVLSVNSQRLSFTPLKSGIMIASQTLYPGEVGTVNGETLSLASSGSVMVVKSGESTMTEGLGDYIWQGIATSNSASKTGSASRSTGTSGSTTTGGSESLASSTDRSSTAGAETGRETTAVMTTANVPPLEDYDELDCPYKRWSEVVHPRAWGCDTPGYYNVTLKPDHTVQGHFKILGKDLTPHLLRQYEHGYVAHLENNSDVELIRRDTGFLRLESAMMVEVMPLNMTFPRGPFAFVEKGFVEEPWDEFHPNWPAWPNEEIRRQLAPSTPTRLPEGTLQPIRPLTDREMNSPWAYPQENEYEIGLQPGHTLEDHFSIIERRFPDERLTHRRKEDPEYLETAGYTILLEGDDAMRDLDAIRSDSGVAYVGQVVYWNAVCGLNGDMPHMSKEEARKLCAEGKLPM